MDLMDIRVFITLASFVAFVGIVIWAYSGDAAKRFSDAAALPFADDDMQARTVHTLSTADRVLPEEPKTLDSAATDRLAKEQQEVSHG